MAGEYLNNPKFQTLICRFQGHKRDILKYQYIIENLKELSKILSLRQNVDAIEQEIQLRQSVYKQLQSEFRDIQDELAQDFYKLSRQICGFSNFNYLEIDDSVQESVMMCFDKTDKFDPNFVGKNGQKTKAFSYMTTCIFNQCKQMWRNQKNYQDFKKKFKNWLSSQVTASSLKAGADIPVMNMNMHD